MSILLFIHCQTLYSLTEGLGIHDTPLFDVLEDIDFTSIDLVLFALPGVGDVGKECD